MCDHHEMTLVFPNPEGYEDSNVRRLALRLECKSCGEPLRWIGVDRGHSLNRPCTSVDGFTIFIPGVMGIEDVEHIRRLHS